MQRERHRFDHAVPEPRSTSWLESALHDLRYGLRLAWHSPGFAVATILTVALGIGATTAMFGIVHGVLFRPLPYAEPDRLVSVWTSIPSRGLPRAFVTAADFRDWKERNRVFAGMALVRAIGNFNLADGGEPERIQGALVSANLFPLLGVTPLLGRTFTAAENEDGRDRVVLLSYGLWQRRYAADPGAVGRTITLNGFPYTIVGVMRRDFAYPAREFAIWTPLTINPDDYVTRLNNAFLAVARLGPAVTLEQASADLSAVAAALAREHPATNDGVGVEVVPLYEDVVAAVRTPLFILLAAVMAVLLIGCANIASLTLARALARQRELAVRAALGASRARLVSQSITEILPALAAGGSIGVLVATWALHALTPALPANLPRVEHVAINVPVLAVSALSLFLVAILTGLWPALHAARAHLASAITECSRGATAAPRRARVRDLIVGGQIALTLVLIVGATLLARSFAAVAAVDPGFRSAGVFTAHLAIPRAKYPTDRAVAEFCRTILERARALPGVESAALVNRLPMAGGIQTGPIEFEGVDPAIGSVPGADLRTVTPDYFRTLGIPLRRGRDVRESDGPNAPLVGVIDERLATRIWPDGDPIGREFGIRMTLGARRRDVALLVIRHGGLLFAAGAAIGLALALVTVRALRTLVFEIEPFDPISFTLATLLLLAVSLTACYVPARRASRIDPNVALRHE